MSEEESRRVQNEHDRMFPLWAEGHFIRNCPQLVTAETSEVGTVAFTLGTSGPSQAGRGGSGRGGSTAPGRGRGRGAGGRGSTPIFQIQSGTRTQARVFTVTL